MMKVSSDLVIGCLLVSSFFVASMGQAGTPLCTGGFTEGRRRSIAKPGTNCVGGCVDTAGRWGSTFCWTSNAKTVDAWGAPCAACPDEAQVPKKWTAQPSTDATCTAGVCSRGKWAAFFGGKTDAQCKAICDAGRLLIPEPEGLVERVFKFHQNGQFHMVMGGQLEGHGAITAKTPLWTRKVDNISYGHDGGFLDDKFHEHNLREHFYMRWEGFLEIKTAGNYKFTLKSDDGSRVNLDGAFVVEDPGWHGMRKSAGAVVALTAGKHAFWAETFGSSGGAGCKVYYEGPDTGGTKVIIPKSVFSASLENGAMLVLPREGLHEVCTAYSHKGTDCVTYTKCDNVSPTAKNICEDSSLDWVDSTQDFKTCTYPPLAPHVAPTTPPAGGASM